MLASLLLSVDAYVASPTLVPIALAPRAVVVSSEWDQAKPLRFEAAADGGAAVGARGAASAHNPPIPTAVASGPDPAPREPLGWALGRSMHLEETRRLLGLCARFERAQGQRGELSVAQLAPLFTRALGPAHADDALLHDALIAAATPPVNGAPLPAWQRR